MKLSLRKKLVVNSLLLLGVAATVLLLPKEAHAEAIQKTLQENQAIKNIHTGLLNIVNIPIIVVVVIIAFAEMLRIKIDTYGFKKLLPSLLLAIIAAQFSYLFCRLLIDLSNMVMTLFLTPGLISDASGLPKQYEGAFKQLFEVSPPWDNWSYSMFFPNLLNILFLLVGSVLILVLCFIFWVRIWMIYFLVIVSSVAFMALAVPQTKKYFDKWWQEFFRWTFMPIPSIFLIWFASVFINPKNYIITSTWFPLPIMNVIIAIVCLYGAVRMPFVLGGQVMDKYWRFSGGRWYSGVLKKFWGTKLNAFGKQTYARFRRIGLDMQREGKNPVSRWLGKNWIGAGTEKAEADLAHADSMLKGIKEGVQARHYYGKGKKFQLEREWIHNREGEIGEFEKYAVNDIIEDGKRKKDKESEAAFKQLSIWRGGSAAAKVKMATADAAREDLLRSATTKFMDQKFFDQFKDANGNYDAKKAAAGLKELVGSGFSDPEEVRKFWEYYKAVYGDQASTEMTYNKRLRDPLKHAQRERVGIHNVADFKETADAFERAYNENGELFERIIRDGGEMSNAFNQMNDAMKEKYKKYVRSKQKMKKMAIDFKAISQDDDFSDPTVIAKSISKARDDYKNKLAQIGNPDNRMIMEKDDRYSVPLWLRDMVNVNETTGQVTINPMDNFTASRSRIWLEKDTGEAATEWLGTYGVNALGESLMNGLPQENFTGDDMLAIHRKEIRTKSTSGSMEKATRAYNALIKAMMTGSGPQRSIAAEYYLNFLKRNNQTQDFLEIGQRLDNKLTDAQKQKMRMDPGSDYRNAWDQIQAIRSSGGDLGQHPDLVNGYSDHLLTIFKDALSRPGGDASMMIGEMLGERARIGDAYQG